MDNQLKFSDAVSMVLAGKRITEGSKNAYRELAKRFIPYNNDMYPTDGFIINEFFGLQTDVRDTTILKWYKLFNSIGRYIERRMGRNQYGVPNYPNPCVDVERPKVQHRKRRYFTKDDLMVILKATRSEMEISLISVLIDSACRIGGLCELKGMDVMDGAIKVKEKTGERIYRLDVKICRKLKELAGSDEGFVFTRKDGRKYNANRLASVVRYIIVRAGFKGEKLGAHTIRHSVASMVARSTGSPLAVKAILQHDNISTSMLYIHDIDDEIKQATSPLELAGIGAIDESPEKQFIDESSTAIVIRDGDEIEVPADVVDVQDLVNDMFPDIEPGINVRPKLSYDDLVMIKELAVSYARSNRGDSLVYQSQRFLKRVLQRSGKLEKIA